jgi:hypothetical protein
MNSVPRGPVRLKSILNLNSVKERKNTPPESNISNLFPRHGFPEIWYYALCVHYILGSIPEFSSLAVLQPPLVM